MARVLVLMGGDAPEREISLKSGRAVAKALARNKHQVWSIDISYRYENSLPPDSIPPPDPEPSLQCSPLTLPYLLNTIRPEVVFTVMKGGYGVDVTLQSILELLRFH